MAHLAIENVLLRAERARGDSDFEYFFSLLLAAETLTKVVVLGLVAAITEDKDRNRYRLEHHLVRADGIGEWTRVLEDALSGPASQFLSVEAREEQVELTRACKEGEWQYDAVSLIKSALDVLGIESEELPVKSDLKRWFRLFATLRNKTRGHGATQTQKAAAAADLLIKSIELLYSNFRLFKREWAHLYRNLSGKYRVSLIAGAGTSFEFFKKNSDVQVPNGVYIWFGNARPIQLIRTDAELNDIYFANGGFSGKRFELLSYVTDNKISEDATPFLTPPGVLPPSETEGHGELMVQGNCLSNAPDLPGDYVRRQALEDDLKKLLLDDRRPVITLLGRGGIGKTSLALRVIQDIYTESRFEGVVWLSARDVDLQLSGPKPVRPLVLSPEDMAKFYARLVLPAESYTAKGFNARSYLEQQLQSSDLSPCLFVFDNFETTQNPIEMFNWIDAFIRLPNKALITTRLREFKGDYPVEVKGMTEDEARTLIRNTANSLGILELLNNSYIQELIDYSDGHPYVIKILLGEVAKQNKLAHIPNLVAGTEDILTALFERTYASLSPCSQRAFLTLAAWNSQVPRVALEAVLYRSTQERGEVERGIDALLQYSMAEVFTTSRDRQEFIGLPLVATVFGKRKLAISPARVSILSDVEVLQLLGPSRRDDVTLNLAKKLERFIGNIASQVESGASYETYAPVVEMICRAYPPAWLIVARWHMEQRSPSSYEMAKEELRRFLESGPAPSEAAEAWKLLGHACYQLHDAIGEVHSFIERAQLVDVPFYDLSNTAFSLNQYLRNFGFEIDREQKRELANRLLAVMHSRKTEANGDDLSRMAWLAIHCGSESAARDYVELGLRSEPTNYHLCKLSERLAS